MATEDDLDDLDGWDDAGSGVPAGYALMSCVGKPPFAAVRLVSEWSRGPWMMGKPIAAAHVPTPLVFRIDPAYPGNLEPLYDEKIPLFRHDLVEALRRAGVENLQLFPAVIRDEANGTEHTDYQAVNVLDVLGPVEGAAAGLKVFRLEQSHELVVHDSVREHLAAVPGMLLRSPG